MKADVNNGLATNPRNNAGAARPPRLKLAPEEAMALTRELAAQLESVLRALRRFSAPERDLGAEIETLLSERPKSSTIEIARGIRARDRDVRVILNSDPRFQLSSPPPGRSRKVKTWIPASTAGGVVPGDGTSSERLTRGTANE